MKFIYAALLDPTLQKVKGISEYLANKQQSPEEFFIYMIYKMVPLNIIKKQIKLYIYVYIYSYILVTTIK